MTNSSYRNFAITYSSLLSRNVVLPDVYGLCDFGLRHVCAADYTDLHKVSRFARFCLWRFFFRFLSSTLTFIMHPAMTQNLAPIVARTYWSLTSSRTAKLSISLHQLVIQRLSWHPSHRLAIKSLSSPLSVTHCSSRPISSMPPVSKEPHFLSLQASHAPQCARRKAHAMSVWLHLRGFPQHISSYWPNSNCSQPHPQLYDFSTDQTVLQLALVCSCLLHAVLDIAASPR